MRSRCRNNLLRSACNESGIQKGVIGTGTGNNDRIHLLRSQQLDEQRGHHSTTGARQAYAAVRGISHMGLPYLAEEIPIGIPFAEHGPSQTPEINPHSGTDLHTTVAFNAPRYLPRKPAAVHLQGSGGAYPDAGAASMA